jgi:hypothetical protein
VRGRGTRLHRRNENKQKHEQEMRKRFHGRL